MDIFEVCSFKTRKSQRSTLSCNWSQLSTWTHKCYYSFSPGRSNIWLAWKEKGIHFVGSNFDQWLDYDWSCPKQNSTLYWQNHYFFCSRVSSSIYSCLHIRNISSKVVEHFKAWYNPRRALEWSTYWAILRFEIFRHRDHPFTTQGWIFWTLLFHNLKKFTSRSI